MALSCVQGRAPFQEAIVFVVGGGNYIEYQNLQDFCQVHLLVLAFLLHCGHRHSLGRSLSMHLSLDGLLADVGSFTPFMPCTCPAGPLLILQRTGNGRRITYGSSQLLSPDQFIDEMTRLGTMLSPAASTA